MTGQEQGGVWTESFKVHSYDVDFNKTATLEALCRHFQEAAWNHAEQLGAGYQRLQHESRFWVLARLLVEVTRHPGWCETVTLKTWPRAAKSVFAMRDFEMFDSRGARIVAGTSCWLVLDAKTRKPQRVDKLISAIKSPQDIRALEREPQKLECGILGVAPRHLIVQYSDIDVNGHANNARYIGWLQDSYAVEFHRRHTLTSLEINFLGEAVGGNSILARFEEKAPGEHWHSMVMAATGGEVCRARLVWCQSKSPDPAFPA
jgi:acyl-ACP thioesterase